MQKMQNRDAVGKPSWLGILGMGTLRARDAHIAVFSLSWTRRRSPIIQRLIQARLELVVCRAQDL